MLHIGLAMKFIVIHNNKARLFRKIMRHTQGSKLWYTTFFWVHFNAEPLDRGLNTCRGSFYISVLQDDKNTSWMLMLVAKLHAYGAVCKLYIFIWYDDSNKKKLNNHDSANDSVSKLMRMICDLERRIEPKIFCKFG